MDRSGRGAQRTPELLAIVLKQDSSYTGVGSAYFISLKDASVI